MAPESRRMTPERVLTIILIVVLILILVKYL